MSPNTQKAIKTAINLFENFCQVQFQSSSDKLFAEISEMQGEKKERVAFDVLQDFINHLDGRELSALTTKLTVLRLKSYFAYRTMIKLHHEDIRSELKFPRTVKRKSEPLSVETILRVLDYSRPEKKALYLFLISSGVRIGEAVQLRKRDFEQFGQRFRISIRGKYTKTKQARITFASKEAENYLRPILEKIGPDTLVFGTNEDPFQAMQNEETYFLRLRQRAGLTDTYDSGTNKVTIHAFRSYFVTKCEKINEGLGHCLAGHDRYMKEYERYTDEELLEFYLKVEPYLGVYQSHEYLKTTQDLQEKMVEVENELGNLRELKEAFLNRKVVEMKMDEQGNEVITFQPKGGTKDKENSERFHEIWKPLEKIEKRAEQ